MLITLRLGYEFLVILPIHQTVRTYRHQSFQVAHRRWQICRWRIGSWKNLKSACTYIFLGPAYRYEKCCNTSGVPFPLDDEERNQDIVKKLLSRRINNQLGKTQTMIVA